ncbi:glycosyltransferase family 4 protein [Rhodophyticola sp. MJ-SS7]|nr:glycosyltransferase family 4 protein [Rhodophyticola sp. MJ-SS7]
MADGAYIYAHFAHTPASVARYAAAVLGVPFSISAHAKDIWTSPDWELAEKLVDARWTVTCTQVGLERLRRLAPDAVVHLCYHGLDLDRFGVRAAPRPPRDGNDPEDPVRILSVGRAVPKKGYDTILAALAALPSDLNWRFEHIGRGPELARLKAEADGLGLGRCITWSGQQGQEEVLKALRRADLFVLASQAGADSDRDGLPNVLLEASSQRLTSVATAFSAIPELIEDNVTGCLVPTGDAEALSAALERCARDPDMRARLGAAAELRVRTAFDARPGIARLVKLLET